MKGTFAIVEQTADGPHFSIHLISRSTSLPVHDHALVGGTGIIGWTTHVRTGVQIDGALSIQFGSARWTLISRCERLSLK
jgi:hypothetical protein